MKYTGFSLAHVPGEPATDGAAAFAFHEREAAGLRFVRPRTKDEYRNIVNAGGAVSLSENVTMVGACYSYVAEESDTDPWEFGGVLLVDSCRGKQLADPLGAFCIGLTLAMERPWKSGREVIAHVHVENPLPRSLLVRLGFTHTHNEEYEAHLIPGLPQNARGKVEALIFKLQRDAGPKLADILENACAQGLELRFPSGIASAEFIRAVREANNT